LSFFDERADVTDANMLFLSSVSEQRFVTRIGVGLALREALFGLDGVRAAVDRFHLPQLSLMQIDAAQRMIALGRDDEAEIMRLRQASRDDQLVLSLTGLPSIDHNGVFDDGLSSQMESLGNYTVYFGINNLQDPERISQLFTSDYGAAVRRVVAGLHGYPGMMIAAKYDPAIGQLEEYVGALHRRDAEISSFDTYLGKLVRTLLVPHGDILLVSCQGAQTPEESGVPSNIVAAASELGRDVIGVTDKGLPMPYGSTGLMHWGEDPISNMRRSDQFTAARAGGSVVETIAAIEPC
jgi:hypothetical protein